MTEAVSQKQLETDDAIRELQSRTIQELKNPVSRRELIQLAATAGASLVGGISVICAISSLIESYTMDLQDEDLSHYAPA